MHIKIEGPIGIIADVHIGSSFHSGEYFNNAIHVMKKKVDYIFVIGDLFEGAPFDLSYLEEGPISQIEKAEDIFSKLEGIPIYVIPGNHDLIWEYTEHFEIDGNNLIFYKNKSIFDLVLELSSKNENIIYIPYFPFRKFSLLYFYIHNRKYKVALSHNPNQRDKNIIKQFGPDIHITGHAHRLRSIESKKGITLEAGCFQYKAPFHRDKGKTDIGFYILDLDHKGVNLEKILYEEII